MDPVGAMRGPRGVIWALWVLCEDRAVLYGPCGCYARPPRCYMDPVGGIRGPRGVIWTLWVVCEAPEVLYGPWDGCVFAQPREP